MLNLAAYQDLITNYWDQFHQKHEQKLQNTEEIMTNLKEVIALLDQGQIRVVEKKDEKWQVNGWIKMAIVLFLGMQKSYVMPNENESKIIPSGFKWFDKIEGKFVSWSENDFREAQIRVLPGTVARKGSFIDKNAVLMPSFINIGAYVGSGTMIDTWSTVGSCAYIGKNCHISGGVGIGGVLEPIQETPVIIEDNVFIGARSEIVEGVIVGEGSVISMGVHIGASTRVINRENGKIMYKNIPPYSVVVPGSFKTKSAFSAGELSLSCAVIIKTVDESTRAKTKINELLRL